MGQHERAESRPPALKAAGSSGIPAGEPPAVVIPDHQLLQRIGQGGYGEVWMARNTMGMYRAVKVVFRASFEDQRPFEREWSGIRKFEPVSRSHEGFVDVLHVGMNEELGYFYYVMELGDDLETGQVIRPGDYSPKTLAKEIKAHGKLSFQGCLELGLALSQAVAELHKHGLVHRDIKPSNIVFINGVPKLADIGLVADLKEAQSYVGTEGFIPPEGPGTASADVYSLGKVLYEASTGKDRNDFPELPTLLSEFPDRTAFLELNEVILHACQNEAAKRYQTAWEMYSDLLLLTNGKSVRRLRQLERRLATIKRLGSVTAMVLAALALIGYQAYSGWKGKMEIRQRQVGASVAYGNRAVESGDLLGALPHYAEALRLDQGDANRELNHRLRLGSSLAQCPKLVQVLDLEKAPFRAASRVIADGMFTADGSQVVLAQMFGMVRTFDVRSGNPTSPMLGEGRFVNGAAFSPDGQLLAISSSLKNISLWNTATWTNIQEYPHPQPVMGVRFSPEGRRIVTTCFDGSARVWDVPSGRVQFVLTGHVGVVRSAFFSSDGEKIVTCGEDATARLWRASDGQPWKVPVLQHQRWVYCAGFSPDGLRVVTGCGDHQARVWEVDTGRQIRPDLTHGDVVQSTEFSPDGRLLLTAGNDSTVRLWDAGTLLPAAPYPTLWHDQRVNHACFSPDGRYVLAAGFDGSVRIWDLAGTRVPPVPAVGTLGFDGSRFLTRTNGGIQVWDAPSGNWNSPPLRPKSPVLSAGLSRNGGFAWAMSAASDSLHETNLLVQIWDVASGRLVRPAFALPGVFKSAALSNDGKRLAVFGMNVAQVWDVAAGAPGFPPLLYDNRIRCGSLSRDGTRVAIGSGSNVMVWNAVTGQRLLGPLEYSTEVNYTEFSPRGTYLAACCRDEALTRCYAQVWNVTTGRAVGPRLNHGDGVFRVEFSPDERRVITASEDFTAVVWDVATGKRIAGPLRHAHQVKAAKFSHDGQWVITASSDKTARIWSAETGDPLTPPLRHPEDVQIAYFLADDRHASCFGTNDRSWVWELPVDQRPVDDLRQLARLLSGDTVTSAGGDSTASAEPLLRVWHYLRDRYPSDFTVSEAHVLAWRDFLAQQGELEGRWDTAAFHLRAMLAACPGDASVAARLAKADENRKARE